MSTSGLGDRSSFLTQGGDHRCKAEQTDYASR